MNKGENQHKTPVKLLQEIGLESAEQQRLAYALGCPKPEGAGFEQRIDSLYRVAFTEYVNWLLGKRRFNSISSIDQYRVLQLFAIIRKDPPTVKEIVNALAMPESKAVAMLSRLRYGEARLLRALVYKSAADGIKERLGRAPLLGERKSIYVSVDQGSCIEEANINIMMDQEAREKDGRYEKAERAERGLTSRYGQEWTATEDMWNYIIQWLDDKGKEEP